MEIQALSGFSCVRGNWALIAARAHAERSRQLSDQAVQVEVQYERALERQKQLFDHTVIGAVSALVLGAATVYVVPRRGRKRGLKRQLNLRSLMLGLQCKAEPIWSDMG